MSQGTKKVGSSGRYGARYGVSLRKRMKNIEDQQRKRHTCPKCTYKSLKRVSTGIWSCKRCGLRVAGGAYLPRTKIDALRNLKTDYR